jgi:hypothetical protein
MKSSLSAAQKSAKDFEAASRLTDELITNLDQMLGSRQLELYNDHEKTCYAHEEKTTREQFEATRSYLIEARGRFPVIKEGLLKASDP